MDLLPIPILQRQVDTTLQLVISLSSMMTTDEVMMVRIRLTEANIILGSMLAERNGATPNGKSIPTLL